MTAKNFIQPIQMASFNTTGLGAYAPLNPAGLPKACSFIRIINNSNTDVMISYDGITDHDFIPHNSELYMPVQSINKPTNNTALFKQGTVIYVGGVAGIGIVYLSGYFQE
jgi:hypothetical protein